MRLEVEALEARLVPNAAPVAMSQSITTNEDTSIPGQMAATDADNDTLRYSVVTTPAHGGNFVFSNDGTFTYIPDPDYNGPDSFTFIANDGQVDSNLATVSITVTPVNDIPVANNDNDTTNKNIPVNTGVLVNDVLGNDPTIGDQPVIVTIATPAGNGTAVVQNDNSVTYTPTFNFSGADSYQYTITDANGDASTATVFITVTAFDNPPMAQDQAITTFENTPTTGTLAATDVDLDSLTYSLVDTSNAHGTVTISNVNTGAFSYTPTAGYVGSASFTFSANDGSMDSTPATVNINVVQDPIVFVDDSWAALPNDTIITDADPIAVGDQTKTIGVNAFSTIGAGLTALNGFGGTDLYVLDGTYAEAVTLPANVTMHLDGITASNPGPVTAGNATVTINSLAGTATTATVDLAYGGPTYSHSLVIGDGTTTSFAGLISGAGGSLTKTGSGSFTLGNVNTYTGATTINAGTLTLGVNNALSTSTTVTINNGTANGSTLAMNGHTNTVAGVQLVDGSITGAGTLTSTTAFDVRKGTISASLAGSVGLNKTTAGNVILAGVNTYTGPTNILGGGTLTVGINSALSSSTCVTINNGSTLAIGTFNDTVGQVHLVNGNITGGTGTLTSGATYDVQCGTASAKLAGTTSAIGLTKTTSGTVILSGIDCYGGATTLSAGTLTVNGTLTTATTAVTLSGANTTLNGTGTINRPVVVNSLGDTVGAAGAGNGLTITAAAGTGITVNATGSVAILGNTIKTGSGLDSIAIDICGGKAIVQDNNLNAVGVTAGTYTPSSLPAVSAPYYGIVTVSGGIVDAGQVGGVSFISGLYLTKSAGNNTLAGYQNYVGSTLPWSLSRAVAQAIVDDNTNSPNNAVGPKGQPYDLYAQNNNFGVPISNNNYLPIEQLVYHDNDFTGVGFTNYVTPVAGNPRLLTSMFYSVNAGELGAQQLTFTGFTNGQTFTLTLNGRTTANITYSSTAITLATNIQNALAALPFVGSGNVLVGGRGPFTVSFIGALNGVVEPTMTASTPGGGTSITVNSFADQKSMIRRVAFAFNNFVTISSGGVGLKTQASQTINMTATQTAFDPANGAFRYEYGFATGQTGVEASGSLADGNYQLCFNLANISGANGAAVLPSGTYHNPNSAITSSPSPSTNGNYVGNGSNYTLNFHRVFGDLDGIGYINQDDINAMAAALGKLFSQGGYLADLDYNNDLSIDTTTDNAQFTNRKNFYTMFSNRLGKDWDD